jgi:hypothetical protein
VIAHNGAGTQGWAYADMYSSTTCDGDYEGNMARAQLMSIKKSADRLFNMIGDNEGLEAWVQSKLTRAADEITSVYQYLDYEKNKNATAGDGMGTPSDKETGTM